MIVFRETFRVKKAVIAMVQFGVRHGAPFYGERRGLDALFDGARNDPKALREAGADAVMLVNENDRPSELLVDPRRAGKFISRSAATRGA